MRVTQPFDFAQGRESFDFTQDRELVERPAERQMGFSRQPLNLFVIILSARDRMRDEWADEILA
jgi:hypothetical protein